MLKGFMANISRTSFGERLANLLGLKPEEGKTFTCTLPQGTFIITLSPELSESERHRYEMLTSKRSVHVEGFFQSFGVEYEVSFDDLDGDGAIGEKDYGGIFDSAEYFIGEEMEGMAARFYRILTEIIEEHIAKSV